MLHSKIKKSRVVTYRTTDNRVFLGTDAKQRAEEHQKELDEQALFKNLDRFLRRMFIIESKEDEALFCAWLMKHIEMPNVKVKKGNFENITAFFYTLYKFLGPKEWGAINEFFERETSNQREGY